MSGLEVLTAISDGRIDHPSMAHTLGFRITEVDDGFAVIEGTTSPDYCNPNGTIHGAWPSALLDSCMGSAVHSMLPAGVGLATARACLKLWLGFSPERSGIYSAGNGPAMRSAVLSPEAPIEVSRVSLKFWNAATIAVRLFDAAPMAPARPRVPN